jgi:hypothetical protein
MSRAQNYLDRRGVDYQEEGSRLRLAECPVSGCGWDLTVNADGSEQDGLYKCWKCEAKGNLRTLIRAYGDDEYTTLWELDEQEEAEGGEISESSRRRLERQAKEVVQPTIEELFSWNMRLLHSEDPLPSINREILEQRKIDFGVLTQNMVGLRPAMKFMDKGQFIYTDALVLPYLQNDVCVYCKYRTLGKMKLFAQFGPPAHLYNEPALKKCAGKDVLICEGELDALAGMTCGFNVVGVPGANALKPSYIKALAAAQPRITWLCFDNDSAGLRATARWKDELEGLTTRKFRLPQDCLDLNKALIKLGKEGLQNYAKEQGMMI